MTAALLRTDAWKTIYLPFIEQRLQVTDPLISDWTALDLEKLLLVAIEHGIWNMDGLRNGLRVFLTSERGGLARRFLGFTYNRSKRRRTAPAAETDLGIPSAGTISRARAKHLWPLRAEHARRLFEAIRDVGLALPEVQALCDVQYLDSMDVFISGRRDDNDEAQDDASLVRKHRRVPGAGRVGHRRADKPGGDGFKIHDISIALALPIALEVTAIDVADKTAALVLVIPKLGEVLATLPRRLRVMCADAAYWGADLTTALRRMGFVPCIHRTSHGPSRKSRQQAADRNARRTRLAGTLWFANGHFELFCACGAGTASLRRPRLGRRGRALITTVCECATCGEVHVTASRWRYDPTANEFCKIDRPCPPKQLRPFLGIPLTFNDKRAAAYARGRYGYQENLHSQLEHAYNVGGKNKRCPIISQAHLEYVVYMIAAMMWANAIERILEARQSLDATLMTTRSEAALRPTVDP